MVNFYIVGLLICSSVLLCKANEFEEIGKGNLVLQFLVDSTQNYAQILLKDVIQEKITIQIGANLNVSQLEKIDTSVEGEDCFENKVENYVLCIYYQEDIDSGYKISWRSKNTSAAFQDCIKLQTGNVSWYGGHEMYQQLWPVEKSRIGDMPYITNGSDNGAVKENYWLNSLGVYVVVDRTTPLFVDINRKLDDHLCLTAKLGTEYYNRDEIVLNYTIVALPDAKRAHLHAVQNYLGKPTAHPNDRMVKEPIWTTWAKYKTKINDDVVLDFASDVQRRGYVGQIEIDDKWETCYGQREFDVDGTFKNIDATVKKLKEMGFRVTLWTHPFVNDVCPDAKLGTEKGYFVKGINGSTKTSWWDGTDAHMIDFTNTEASQWFVDKLLTLQKLHGIDSFKFDAGESTYAPKYPALNASGDVSPNKLTEAYLRTCARLGNLTEVRSAWATQDLGIFVRMLDKDSRWGYDNGLKSLITTLLQMNIVGYGLVLPDMIGGNGYQNPPTPELLVRWTQANTFMPAMQFSYLPWEITSPDFDVPAIVKSYINLHDQYSDEILAAMKKFIEDGTPVNPPLWWIDPSNKDLWMVDDQFLLGEKIMVAPIVEEGAVSRKIYFPKGKWQDGTYGTILDNVNVITNYTADIRTLPYFIRLD